MFIPHTSTDDAFIKGFEAGGRFPDSGSIWWICGEFFCDPFYHSRTAGGAGDYERIVGLSLSAATRVLAIWSKMTIQSDYVRVEILIVVEDNKKLAAYLAPDASLFLFVVPQVTSLASLRILLQSWN